jgi:hypothetical protein
MRAGLVCSLVAAALLGSCGGGLSIGIGGFCCDDVPPSVSIASTATTVKAGQPVRFVAAASDADSGVDNVSFYRVDGNNGTLLGTDVGAPYEIETIAPTDGRTTLTVFARAQDRDGNWADSLAVTVDVTP